MNKRSKVYSPTDLQFRELVMRCSTYSDVLRELGLTPRGGSSSKILKRRIQSLGINTSHFQAKYERAHSVKAPLLSLLVKESPHQNRGSLKRRLVSSGLLPYCCQECGLENWLGKPLSLQLDHIDGDNSNNTLSNLRLLCPNCHSQTVTYAGRNRR